jgi:diketogulonate reductase-like aldo/keto reductase
MHAWQFAKMQHTAQAGGWTRFVSMQDQYIVTSPIVGPTKPRHLADAIAALDITLADEEIRVLEEPYTPRQPTG